MTTGSTEGEFSTSTQALRSFNSNLLKSETNKFCYGAQVLATVSTDGFWEDDPEEKVKKKVLMCKSIFHMGRSLEIKHLPRDVTEAEIRELLNDFPVTKITLSSGMGSLMARADLEDPEMLEEWDRERKFLLRGQCVPVCPAATEMMLCVANLPLDYSDDQFNTLVKACGEVMRCFLMISEKTGESKGYGFVEYKNRSISLAAKNVLDRQQISGHTLVCDWLYPKHVTFESLHSKCLYVDRLPKNFRDMSEFRKIFSAVVNPPYCQIALKHGCPQDWGLVEYSNWEDAEAAQTLLNGYNLHGQDIRISYYIPGVPAINLYLQLLNDSQSEKKSTGLLPEPSGQAIMQNLQNLFKQNPTFARNLQNIITSQIQAAKNSELPPAPKQGPPLPIMPDPVRKPMYSFSEVAEMSKSPISPQPPPKKGLHLSQGSSPTQFHKATPPPPTKIPLLPNPSMAPPPLRRLSLSPPGGKIAPLQPGTAPLEEETSPTYRTGLLGQLREGLPTPVSSSAPLPKPPSHPYNIPPPNFNREPAPNMYVELHQYFISNPQNFQQILTNLHLLRQSPSPSPVPPPAFSYPLNPMDPSCYVRPPPPRSLLTSPIPVPMSPETVNFKEPPPVFPSWDPMFLPPSSHPMFTPIGSPLIMWSPMVPPQPNPMMTPIGHKRRLLPSPEPIPEGNYIGQHSQGLGGHYADSYFKRQKKD